MLLAITLTFLWDLSWALPNDAQHGRTGVVKDNGAIKEVVLVNGVPVGLLHNGVYNMTIVAISVDALINVDKNNSFPNSLTYVPLSECTFKSQRVVLLSDRIGKDILVLYPANDTWRTYVPQGDALGQIWNNDTARYVLELLLLKENCARILEDLDHLEKLDGSRSFTVLVCVVLATVAFAGLILLSFTIFKNHAIGGVLGSIVHYPAHSLGMGHKQEPSNLPPVSRVPY